MRATSGQGAGPVHLLGFGYGGSLVYVVAGRDSQRPGNLKNIKGIIAVESASLKTNDSQMQTLACAQLKSVEKNYQSPEPIYYSPLHKALFGGFRDLGDKAKKDPDGISPTMSPLTNNNALNASLIKWGFLAGIATTNPPTLYYTEASRLPSLAAATPIYFPYHWTYDLNASLCESMESPTIIDDYFSEITIPIYYVSRTEAAFYTALRTGSTDINKYILELPTPKYGLADLFFANNAADYVWRPILDWILDHQ
jgi:hypothetical protein